ncbi:hypothetical protein [Staphylococcus pasteuri]|uniref:hypothetical protein n=1 Tax=Staphylococcus pasteuri TaxID=45972 RepID=UPI002DB6ED45|nr:hypothetical protein [Staphylococcus pasteuri]MEB7435279.1 hypothetical protein [Staphylococcus pasteuri]
MEKPKSMLILTTILFLICLTVAAYFIFYEHNYLTSLYPLILAFVDSVKFYTSYQKLKEHK